MYFPYLRGRQFELIALRELIEKSLIGEKIIPIVEPVKMSSTLVKTLECYNNVNRKIAYLYNPKVGGFSLDAKKETNQKHFSKLQEALKSDNIIDAHLMCKRSKVMLESWIAKDRNPEDLMIILDDEDYLDTYLQYFEEQNPLYTVMKDESEFRRAVHENRVLFANRFKKQSRNTDYANKEDELYSSDHIYFKNDGYIGFSDYSIIGEDYSESGFAPYAVAIHIVYFDEKSRMRVRHFVSDSNDDIGDPAGKFSEALEKLVEWNRTQKLETYSMNQLIEMYTNKVYPGLGVVKKLTLMHHLELINKYLESGSKI